jgi:hypothetical protein
MTAIGPYEAARNTGKVVRVEDDVVLIDGVPLSLGSSKDIRLNDVAVTTDGKIVVAGQLDGVDGDETGVFFKLYSSDLEELSDFILVNQTTRGDQDSAFVSTTGSGGFIVGWRDTSLRVGPEKNFAAPVRFFDAQGEALTDQINIDIGGAQNVGIVSVGQDEVLIAFDDHYNRTDGNGGIKLVSQSGLVQDVRVPFTFGSRIEDLDFVEGHNGDLWLKWVNEYSSNAYAAILNDNLEFKTTKFQVNQSENILGSYHSITPLSDGSYIASYPSADYSGAKFRKFDGNGVPLTVDLDLGLGNSVPILIPTTDGGFFAVVRSGSGNETLSIFAVRYSADLHQVGEPLQVSPDTETSLWNMSVDKFDGSLISSWFEVATSGSSLPTATYIRNSDINNFGTGVIEISGDATEDENISFTSSIADADGIGDFEIQWVREGDAIIGATQTNYTLGQADVGATISVQVSYTDGKGFQEYFISSGKGPIVNINDPVVGYPIIDNSPLQKQILNVDVSGLSDEDGLGEFTYQWLRDGVELAGTTMSSYTLTQDDVGTQISVEVNYTDNFGTDESVTSDPTGPIEHVNDLPTGSVVITGTVSQGELLNADTSSTRTNGFAMAQQSQVPHPATTS